MQTVSSGQKAEVKSHSFLECRWKCPTCGESHERQDAVSRNGRPSVRCFNCRQEVLKDEKGVWKTHNQVIKDMTAVPPVYREVHGDAQSPFPVDVTELRTRTEKYSWRCVQCGSSNEKQNFPDADDRLFITDPQGEFNRFKNSRGLKDERGEPGTAHLRCWYCGVVLENLHGEWKILEGIK